VAANKTRSGQKARRGEIKTRGAENGAENWWEPPPRRRVSNESISGDRGKTFEGGSYGFSTFHRLSARRQVKSRARSRAANRNVFLSFRCRRRKLRHFMRSPVCGSASIRFRSIPPCSKRPGRTGSRSRSGKRRKPKRK